MPQLKGGISNPANCFNYDINDPNSPTDPITLQSLLPLADGQVVRIPGPGDRYYCFDRIALGKYWKARRDFVNPLTNLPLTLVQTRSLIAQRFLTRRTFAQYDISWTIPSQWHDFIRRKDRQYLTRISAPLRQELADRPIWKAKFLNEFAKIYGRDNLRIFKLSIWNYMMQPVDVAGQPYWTFNIGFVFYINDYFTDDRFVLAPAENQIVSVMEQVFNDYVRPAMLQKMTPLEYNAFWAAATDRKVVKDVSDTEITLNN